MRNIRLKAYFIFFPQNISAKISISISTKLIIITALRTLLFFFERLSTATQTKHITMHTSAAIPNVRESKL